MTKAPVCGWALENAARRGGARRIAGLDEVGRGPMFGPVVAAAVIFPERRRLRGLTDSKQLTEKQRNEFDVAIRECAVAWAIAAVDVETIDRINITARVAAGDAAGGGAAGGHAGLCWRRITC